MIVPHETGDCISLYDPLDKNYENDNRLSYSGDGFWVIFIRDNVLKNSNEHRQFVHKVSVFMNINKIKLAQISLPDFDRLLVYTSCSKREIFHIGNALKEAFKFNECDMIWEAMFESKDSWKENEWLNSLKKAFGMYESAALNCKEFDYKEATILKSKVYQKILEGKIMNRESMIVRPFFNKIDYILKHRTVFIIMPFKEIWSDDVYNAIKEICNTVCATAIRADDMFSTKNDVLDDIWQGINEAELIIADISVKNANVFYELGIAHTLGKDVILLRQSSDEKVPFDISIRRYIEYGTLPGQFAKFKYDLENKITDFFKSQNDIITL